MMEALGLLGTGVAFEVVRRRRPQLSAAAQADRSARSVEDDFNFQAAAESALDAMYILACMRGEDGQVTDFTFRYVNTRGEARLNRDREDLLGRQLCVEVPLIRSEGLFELYCEVVRTGVSTTRELNVNRTLKGVEVVQHHIVKLGDGVAVTSSDQTALRALEAELKQVSSFSDAIFQDAPFSMIATDALGKITAMNAEAEALTAYRREELVGAESLIMLFDREELRQRYGELQPPASSLHQPSGFDHHCSDDQSASRLNSEAARGETVAESHGIARRIEAGLPADRVAEQRTELAASSAAFELMVAEADRISPAEPQEWTYIRRDGTRTPVQVAMKVLRSPDGKRLGTVSLAQETGRAGVHAGSRVLRPTHDVLTGLVGRELLEDRIEQAIMRASRTGTLVGVYVLDLDKFKALNDALGHRTGDEILELTARRLIGLLRRSDTVSRTSGDEFVVVISELKDMAAAELCAEKLVRAIAPAYRVNGTEVGVTGSVGVSVFPELASNTLHLLERAETAMHAAKQAGRNRFRIFEAAMFDHVSSRLSMETELRSALDRGQLFAEYQPQTALPEGRVVGMEALLRWRHPQLGLVSPAHFIPMAEEMGLMPQFGAWVIATACTQARMIQLETGRRLLVSVNLSPYQFQDGRLVESVASALRTSGLAPADLEIEITENTLMVNSTANLAMLQQIRELGVRLSIDDFGTGFSSFSYLLQYKVDRLKIDQSFVRQASTDPNAASVVRTIIAMSHGLGIKVIAEGVETREQLRFLVRRHCDEAQGYFFARPVGADRFAAMVEQIEAMKIQSLAFDRPVSSEHSPGSVDEIADFRQTDLERTESPLRLT